MQETEKCFPRGGKIKRSAADAKDDNEDNLIDDRPRKKVKAKKRKKGKQNERQPQKKANSDNDQESEITYVEPLRQDDLEVGMVLLGRIHDVREFDLLVSLPCHLVGSVPATNISTTYSKLIDDAQHSPAAMPGLSELFAAGQYVSCMVSSTDKSGHKVRNTLSMKPEDVNGGLAASMLGPGLVLQCSVKSEEEHVFDMESGIPSTRAVLPRNKAPALVAGQIVWCVVDHVRTEDGVSTLTLSASPEHLSAAQPSIKCHLTRQNLLPGMRLPITVLGALPGGLKVQVLPDVEGYIYQTQLEEPADSPDDYNAGAVATARVLYTLPMVRRVYLSLRPMTSASALPPAVDPSDNRRSATVLDSDRDGARLLLEGGGVAFCPSWHATRRLARGQQVTCSLLGFDAMDEVHVASLRGGAAERSRAAALGDRVTCRVVELTEAGCQVQLEGSATPAFIPRHHLTSVPLGANAHALFPPGKKLKCRVIHSEPDRRRLQLTHNARLVRSEVTLAFDAGELQRGRAHHWVVASVTERGLLVTGCAGLAGFVPAAFVGPLDAFFPGQILHCAVQKVRDGPAGSRRVTLCPVREGAAGGPAPDDWRGRLCRVTVAERAARGLRVVTEDGAEAELAAAHLTDDPERADAELNRYSAGDELEVVGLAAHGRKLTVSAKPAFLDHVRRGLYPARAEDVRRGARLPGAVVEADEKGVVAVFPCAALPGTYRIRWGALTAELQAAVRADSAVHRTLVAEVTGGPDPETGFIQLSARENTQNEAAPGGDGRQLAKKARKEKVRTKPAKKMRCRDKRWKKNKPAAASAASKKSVRYSRFLLQDT